MNRTVPAVAALAAASHASPALAAGSGGSGVVRLALFCGAGVLLLAGAVLIVIGLRGRPSGSALAAALTVATTTPIPVVAGAGPNPSRRRRQFGATRQDRPLTDPATWTVAESAVDACSAAGARPYALHIAARTITAHLVGAEPPQLPAPWRPTENGWTVDRDELDAHRPPRLDSPTHTYVALGSDDGAALLIDLAAAPGVIAVSGDRSAAGRLVRTFAARLTAIPHHRVLTAVHPAPDSPALDLPDLLELLGDRLDGSPGLPLWTFLVCADPGPAEAARLRTLIADNPNLRVIVLGEISGSRWTLRTDARGEVLAEGLGLTAATRRLPESLGEPVQPPVTGPAHNAPAPPSRSAWP
ncbi:hypothetical protein KDK95_25550, partial [Actinospica sp. MGRD01-02]